MANTEPNTIYKQNKDFIPLAILGIGKVEMALTLDPKGCIVGIPLALDNFKPIYLTSLLNVCMLLMVNNNPYCLGFDKNAFMG